MTRILFSFILLLGLVACGGDTNDNQNQSSEPSSQLEGSVRLDGSSTVFPISEAVAEEYLAMQPRVRVTVGVSGTGGGFKKFINGEIDINAASRPIKASELEKLKAQSVQFVELPVAFDGLSVVVNPANDWVDHLTTEELKRIWQPDSVVKTWADVRPGWPAETIRLYGPGADSGTFDYFTKAINGKEQASRPDFTASEDDNVIVQGIAGDQYSLGYFGYAYYQENKDKLKIVPIDGGAGMITPTEVTINNGTYAPLSRPIYIYVKMDSLNDAQVLDFVNFYLANAGALASEVGYIKLPSAAYIAGKQRIEERRGGSHYHGEIANLLASP